MNATMHSLIYVRMSHAKLEIQKLEHSKPLTSFTVLKALHDFPSVFHFSITVNIYIYFLPSLKIHTPIIFFFILSEFY